MLKIYYENREVEQVNYIMSGSEIFRHDLIFISYLCESGKIQPHEDDKNNKFVYLKDLIPFKGASYICYPKICIPDLKYVPSKVYTHTFSLTNIYHIMDGYMEDDENDVSKLYDMITENMVKCFNPGFDVNPLSYVGQEIVADRNCSPDLAEFILAKDNTDKLYASIGSTFYHYFSVYVETRKSQICGHAINYNFSISDTSYNKSGDSGEFDDFWEEMTCLLKELGVKRLFFKSSAPYGVLRNDAFDDFKVVQYLYQPNGCNDLPFSVDKIFVFFNKDGSIFADNFVRKCKKCGRYFRIGEQDIFRAKNLKSGKKYILPSTCKHCVQKLDLFPNAKKKKGDAVEEQN